MERILNRKGNYFILRQTFSGENLYPLTNLLVRIYEVPENIFRCDVVDTHVLFIICI